MRLSVRVLHAARPCIACAVFLAAVGPAFAQQDAPKPEPPPPTAELTIPPDAAQKPNPVKATPAVLAAAKKTWGYDCAVCHGEDGSGKSDLAADMKLKLLDYRDPDALKNMTDGELFWIISKGKGQMTGEGDRVKAPEIWGLVDYVRSLGKKSSSPNSPAKTSSGK